jgi:hypothetical protein
MKAERIILNDLMSALIQNFGFNEITEEGNLTPDSIVVLDNKKGIWGIDNYDAEKEVYNLVNVETLEETTAKREQITSLNRYSFADTLYDDINDYKEKTEDYDLIYDRLRDLKEKYPDLEEEYPVIKRLLSNVSKDGKISNIELYRADANETSDKNSYIDQFNQLVNYESDDFEKAAEVKDVFKTLMLVGFYQSGYNMSHIYFTDVISLDSMLPKILSANNVFKKINKADPEFAQEMLFAIAELIRYNNPRIYTYETDENTGEIIEPFNRNYWRYKDFTLNLDDIVNSYVERKTGEVIPTAPTEPSTTEAPGLSESAPTASAQKSTKATSLPFNSLKVGDTIIVRDKETGSIGTFTVTQIGEGNNSNFARFDVDFLDDNVSEKELGYSETEFNKYFEAVVDAEDGIEDATNSDNPDDSDSSNSFTEDQNEKDIEPIINPEVKEIPTYEKFVSLLGEQSITTTITKEEFNNLPEGEQQRLIDDTKNCEF